MALDKRNHNYRHPAYEQNYAHWVFLQDSYNGGISYKEKDYLTRYIKETDQEYRNRVEQTPLDNHCKSIVSIYNSFIYKKPPTREFGRYAKDPALVSFLDDADREGRSLDDFMSQVNIVSSIYGHAWVIVDKPEAELSTRAQEEQYDIRPYLSLFTPIQVLDWDYKQNLNGSYYLCELKVLEASDGDSYCIKKFYIDRIEREFIEKGEITRVETLPNNIGVIPAVCVYSSRGNQRGIGVSDISDIADVQRAIFDANSEIEQIVRLSNHPSLVMTRGTEPGAGAGSIIIVEDGNEFQPYLLQPAATSIDSVRNLISDRVETINRMANVGGVRQSESKKISGVALQQEFELLNARLAEKANNLELGEYNIWELYSLWMGITNVFYYVEYADSYNTRDKENDFALLSQAKEFASESPTLYKEVFLQMASLFVEDSQTLQKIANEITAKQQSQVEDEVAVEEEMEHPTTTAANRSEHIQEMIMEGYEDDEILDIHPEISQEDINTAKQELLNING
jgi:hypothetical protein